jgi:hypothetical protein
MGLFFVGLRYFDFDIRVIFRGRDTVERTSQLPMFTPGRSGRPRPVLRVSERMMGLRRFFAIPFVRERSGYMRRVACRDDPYLPVQAWCRLDR